MSNTQEGMYVKDAVTGDVYYAVQSRKYGLNEPHSITLYTDIKCDPLTSVKGVSHPNLLLPESGASGAGAGASDVNVLTLPDVTIVTMPDVTLTPAAMVPFYTRETGTGTTAADTVKVAFANVGSTNVTVMTTTLLPGEVVTFEANKGDTINAIAYVATGGTLAVSGLKLT